MGEDANENRPARGARTRRVADELRAAIRSGEYRPGHQLPSTAALKQRYEVSNQTIQNALRVLRDEGLVKGRTGAGVFVRERPAVRRLSSKRLSRAERQAGRGAMITDAKQGGFTATSDTQIHFERADAATAETLRITEGDEIVVRDRVMHADGVPIQLATSRLPRAVTRGTRIEEKDTGKGGSYARLEDMGYTLRGVEHVIGRPATAEEASTLRLQPGAPVLEVVRTVYAEDGTPLEVNRMVLAGERYELVYEVDMS